MILFLKISLEITFAKVILTLTTLSFDKAYKCLINNFSIISSLWKQQFTKRENL